MGPQLSTGSCRHYWLIGPVSLPPARQAAFPQPGSLKPNSSFQLQQERAPGPAFPGDPAACRSHGQGIFPVQCSKPAEPPEQRARRDSNCLPHFTTPLLPIPGLGDIVDRGCSLALWAGATQRTDIVLLGEDCAFGSNPCRGWAQIIWSSSHIFQLFPTMGEILLCCPGVPTEPDGCLVAESGLLRKASPAPMQRRGLQLGSGEAQVPELVNSLTWGKGYLPKKNGIYFCCYS